MSGRGRFAYAQARLQARLGEAVDPATMDQLHATRDLASLLAAARATSLRRYASRLAPGLESHELERHLRGEWSTLVDEVARWQPREWRPCLGWLRWLPSLPLLQKLARGARTPSWAREDPWLGRVVAVEPPQRPGAIAATPLRPLQAALENKDGDVVTAWLAHWRATWPREPGAARTLDEIVRDVANYAAAVREPAVRSSRDAQRALRDRLQRRLRRHPLSPAAAVAFLALEGLALMELRGCVLRRAVLEPGPP